MPTGGRSRAQRQASDTTRARKKPAMSETDSLRREAYGPQGAALRRMAATAGSDSTIVEKGVARVKGLVRKLRGK